MEGGKEEGREGEREGDQLSNAQHIYKRSTQDIVRKRKKTKTNRRISYQRTSSMSFLGSVHCDPDNY